jgi:F-type H+-transporting ATPase subunit delta
MAEIATLARPYAEALFQVARKGDLKQVAVQLDAVVLVAENPELRRFAGNPTTSSEQILEVLTSVVSIPLSDRVKNLLHTVIQNRRLNVLSEISTQFHTLVSMQFGVSDAIIYSAFPIEPAQLNEILQSIELRFKRKLHPIVKLQPDLIGGIRVVVGDAVLDTSVKARLEQMKAALTT